MLASSAPWFCTISAPLGAPSSLLTALVLWARIFSSGNGYIHYIFAAYSPWCTRGTPFPQATCGRKDWKCYPSLAWFREPWGRGGGSWHEDQEHGEKCLCLHHSVFIKTMLHRANYLSSLSFRVFIGEMGYYSLHLTGLSWCFDVLVHTWTDSLVTQAAMVLKTQKSYCKAMYSTLVTSALNKIICNEQFGFSLKTCLILKITFTFSQSILTANLHILVNRAKKPNNNFIVSWVQITTWLLTCLITKSFYCLRYYFPIWIKGPYLTGFIHSSIDSLDKYLSRAWLVPVSLGTGHWSGNKRGRFSTLKKANE